jgi:fibrillarin-like rRNA methylase
MDIKENIEQEEKTITFDDMVNYMISLGELLTILEDSNAPQKYALQIKICDEIDGILDLLSFNGKA